MSQTVPTVTEANLMAVGPVLNAMRLEQISALPFVEVETLDLRDARAISEAYHLAIGMIDEVYSLTGEVRAGLAKVVASIGYLRLVENADISEARAIEEIASEAYDVMTGLRPLPDLESLAFVVD